MINFSKYYFNPEYPGSFTGFQKFFNSFKDVPKKPNKKDLKEWMNLQESYNIHKPKRKKFNTNKTISGGIDDIWQADLVDIKNISKHNRGTKYLLTCIDVFSKYAWVKPIQNKNGILVKEAFEQIFKERFPKKIHTDRGKEFLNKNVQDIFIKHQIKWYTTNSEYKAAVVERFNRTLKQKMWHYFTFNSTYNYIDVLDQLVFSYNKSYHRSIKMAPNKVNKKNEKNVFKNLYGNIEEPSKMIKFNFKIGDLVRIAKAKSIFNKGYLQNWTTEIFEIQECLPMDIPMYTINDLDKNIIEGKFYEYELQKVYKMPELFKIEKIIKKKNHKTGFKYFVKWFGYPESFNSWIDEKELKK